MWLPLKLREQHPEIRWEYHTSAGGFPSIERRSFDFSTIPTPSLHTTWWSANCWRLVINRKLSGGNRSRRYAERTALLYSVYATLHRQDQDVVNAFLDALYGRRTLLI